MSTSTYDRAGNTSLWYSPPLPQKPLLPNPSSIPSPVPTYKPPPSPLPPVYYTPPTYYAAPANDWNPFSVFTTPDFWAGKALKYGGSILTNGKYQFPINNATQWGNIIAKSHFGAIDVAKPIIDAYSNLSSPFISNNINLLNVITGKQTISPTSTFYNDLGFGGLKVMGSVLGRWIGLAAWEAIEGSGFVLAGGSVAAIAGAIVVPAVVGALACAALVGVGQVVNSLTQPQVGGILFDKCATVVGPLQTIKGAYWDSKKGSLVLLGAGGQEKTSEIRLSDLEFDHFLVALRAVMAGEHIGVSIDPPAEYRDGMREGQFPPNRTPMIVSYLGNTESTLFGAIMFEADRVMKCLSQETDNISGSSMRSKAVKDYKSLFELFNLNTAGKNGNWFRFWIEVDKVEIAHDMTGRTLRFGEVKMIVKNQPETASGTNADPDPASEAFAKHLTDYYDEYAKEFPIFARLREIAKISALARFMVKEGVPFDDQTVFKQPILPVSTPETTPGIVSSSPSGRGGSQLIFGGVDLDIFPTVLNKDDKLAQTLRDLATSADPGGLANLWSFIGPDGLTLAASMKMNTVKDPYRALTNSDHAFSDSWKNSIRSVQRYYDSSVPGGDFGPGWWLFLPYRLQVIPRSVKKSEVRIGQEKTEDDTPRTIILHSFINPGSNIFRRHSEYDNQHGKAYCMSGSQTTVAAKIAIIYFKSDSYCYSDDKYTFHFNKTGLLTSVGTLQSSGLIAKYEWENGLMSGIDFGSDKNYKIKYDKSILNSRISEIVASDGVVVNYKYNDNGLLTACYTGNKPKVSYRYDQRNRVAETLDGDGNLVNSNVYDLNGNINKSNINEILLSDGTKLKSELREGRIISITDETGGKAEYKYRNNGTLKSVSGIITDKEFWLAEYNEDGALSRFKDTNGQAHNISYYDNGMVSKIEQNGAAITFPGMNEKNKAIIGTDLKLGSWKVKLNDNGLPESISDVNQKTSKFLYKQDALKSIKTNDFTFKVVKNNGTGEFLIKHKSGIKQSLHFDKKNKTSQIIVTRKNKRKRELFINDRGFKISDCAGTTEYKFNAKDLEVDLVICF